MMAEGLKEERDLYRRPLRLNLPPLKAIREKCLQDCCQGYPESVRDCLVPYCALFTFRFGKVPENKKGASLLQIIHKKCIECGGGDEKRVASCNIYDCPLYRLRMGKNPSLKGKRIGNKMPNMEGLKKYRERIGGVK